MISILSGFARHATRREGKRQTANSRTGARAETRLQCARKPEPARSRRAYPNQRKRPDSRTLQRVGHSRPAEDFMKKIFLLALLALLTLSAIAHAKEARLMRYPHYHDGRVTFSYLGDIWVAGEDGT